MDRNEEERAGRRESVQGVETSATTPTTAIDGEVIIGSDKEKISAMLGL